MTWQSSTLVTDWIATAVYNRLAKAVLLVIAMTSQPGKN